MSFVLRILMFRHLFENFLSAVKSCDSKWSPEKFRWNLISFLSDTAEKTRTSLHVLASQKEVKVLIIYHCHRLSRPSLAYKLYKLRRFFGAFSLGELFGFKKGKEQKVALVHACEKLHRFDVIDSPPPFDDKQASNFVKSREAKSKSKAHKYINKHIINIACRLMTLIFCCR